jgi:hypothetical protein
MDGFMGIEHCLRLKILHGALCLLYSVAFEDFLIVYFIFDLSLLLFYYSVYYYFFLSVDLLSKDA